MDFPPINQPFGIPFGNGSLHPRLALLIIHLLESHLDVLGKRYKSEWLGMAVDWMILGIGKPIPINILVAYQYFLLKPFEVVWPISQEPEGLKPQMFFSPNVFEKVEERFPFVMLKIWQFPVPWGTPKSSIEMGFPIAGDPSFMETTISQMTLRCHQAFGLPLQSF